MGEPQSAIKPVWNDAPHPYNHRLGICFQQTGHLVETDWASRENKRKR